MSKKNKKKEQEHSIRYAGALRLTLLLEEKCKEREQNANDSCDRSNDGTIKLNALKTVLANEPSIIYERLTFKGYLVMVLRLLKVAIFHKKFNGTAKTLWGFIE